MSFLIGYFIKVVLIQSFLFLIFKLFFGKTGQHKYNRFYLLFSFGIGYIIPLIKLPSFISPELSENEIKVWLQRPELEETHVQQLVPVLENPDQLSLSTLLLLVGVLGMLFMCIRSVYGFVLINKLKRKSQLIKKSWYSLYQSDINTSFTFMRNIFMPQKIINSTVFHQVFQHERVHARRLHSLDRLFMDILICINWSNPVQYLMRKALIEIHEFEADEEVIKNMDDPIDYQEILYQQLQTSSSFGIASYFAFVTIKKRINMINKRKKSPIWIYSLCTPMILLVGLIFTDNNTSVKIPGEKIAILPSYSKVLKFNDPYIPSIFPLEKGVKLNITSKFGLNMEKMHEGIDFSVPEGSKVLATANGKVIKAEKSGEYGLKITIDHNGTYRTSYAHLSTILVKVGQEVRKGDIIGQSGNTGASIFPHLHYEVESAKDGLVDPLNFLDDC